MKRAAFIFIFITVALDMLALGVMIPVLPKLIIEFENGDRGRAAEITGLFGFIWAAMQFAFGPVLGALSDRFGRRPVVLLSNLGMGLDYVLMALAPSLSWLFIGRLISGITSASFPTASAYVADVTPPEERAAKFGMLGAAFGLGFIIGPAVGGLLGEISLRLPFWAAAGLCLLNAAYGFFVLPESLPKEKRAAKFSLKGANPLGSLTLLKSHPVLLLGACVLVLYGLGHEALPSVFVIYGDYRFSWSERDVGWVLASVGVIQTIVSGGLVRPIVRRLGEPRALVFGLVMGALGFAVFAAAQASALIFLIGIPLMGLWGVSDPALSSLMSAQVTPEAQGRLQGAIASLRGLTGMVGPILFTQVFKASISGEAQAPSMVWWFAAGLTGLSLLLSFRAAPAKAPAA